MTTCTHTEVINGFEMVVTTTTRTALVVYSSRYGREVLLPETTVEEAQYLARNYVERRGCTNVRIRREKVTDVSRAYAYADDAEAALALEECAA